jgi:hypothetical protein
MISLLWVRFALAAIGLLICAYGIRVDDAMVRWVGIGFLAVALLLRFAPRSRPPSS